MKKWKNVNQKFILFRDTSTDQLVRNWIIEPTIYEVSFVFLLCPCLFIFTHIFLFFLPNNILLFFRFLFSFLLLRNQNEKTFKKIKKDFKVRWKLETKIMFPISFFYFGEHLFSFHFHFLFFSYFAGRDKTSFIILSLFVSKHVFWSFCIQAYLLISFQVNLFQTLRTRKRFNWFSDWITEKPKEIEIWWTSILYITRASSLSKS